MFTITLAEAIPIMKTALDEGRLQYQNVIPASDSKVRGFIGCSYRVSRTPDGKVIGCAWGVCLPDEVVADRNHSILEDLPFKIEGSLRDKVRAQTLQNTHDRLVRQVSYGDISLDQANAQMSQALNPNPDKD